MIELMLGYFILLWKPIIAGSFIMSVLTIWFLELLIIRFGKDEYGE